VSNKYILVNRKPVAVHDLHAWAKAFEKGADRVVKRETVAPGVDVSTVFLGLDHSFGIGGPPLVFETMVFGGVNDQDMDRYSTWEEAEAGHVAMVEKVRHGLNASFVDVEAK